MILDHAKVSQRYFFPRPGGLPGTFWVPCEGAQLACLYSAPHEGARTLVHFHGNGEIVADYLPDFLEALLGLGVNVLFAEYRGYGDSTGEPALIGMLDDTRAIFEALGLPASKLVVFGRSIGSIYAIEFAARYPEIAGLILESGIADPLERVLLRVSPAELGVSAEAMQAEAKAHLDHEAKLGRYAGPLLVLHTEHDGLVERDHADRNFAWAAGTDKTCKIFPSGDHNSIAFVNWDAYMASLQEFLASLP